MELPKGKTQTKWFRYGYQIALEDIAEAFANDGADGVKSWLDNNLNRQIEINGVTFAKVNV